MLDLSTRSDAKEIMDDLQCRGEVVEQTLRELDFINHWLGGNAVTLTAVEKLLSDLPNGTVVSIADLGCGSGDMLRRLAVWGQRKGLVLKLTGIDANPHIIEYAKAHSADFPEIQWEAVNIFSDAFREKQYDVLLGTLFFHHFSSTDLVRFFRQACGQTRMGIVINDIHRHWLAWSSIALLTRLFSRSPMVRFDAPLSVRRAFTRLELQRILDQAGIRSYSLRWKWAFRWEVIVDVRHP